VTVVDTTKMALEDVRRGRVHMIRRKRLPLESTGNGSVSGETPAAGLPLIQCWPKSVEWSR